MPFEKNASMGFVTNRLARLFAQHLHARIAPLGLAPAQFMTLLELWEGDLTCERGDGIYLIYFVKSGKQHR